MSASGPSGPLVLHEASVIKKNALIFVVFSSDVG